MAPLRCEDEESSESEKTHQSMSLLLLTTPVTAKQQFHMFPGPGCSEDQLYQEDGGKVLLEQHPGIEDLPYEPAWLSRACALPPNLPVLLQVIGDLSKLSKTRNTYVVVCGVTSHDTHVTIADNIRPVLSHSNHSCHFHAISEISGTSLPHLNSEDVHF